MRIVDVSKCAMNTEEIKSAVRDRILFLRFSRLHSKHFKRAEGKSCLFLYTEWKKGWFLPSTLSPDICLWREGVTHFIPQIPVTSRFTQNTHNTVWIIFKIKRNSASLAGVTKKSVASQEIRQSYDFCFI